MGLYETTINRLNVEHRTSNIEHRIMITLRFSDIYVNRRTGETGSTSLD